MKKLKTVWFYESVYRQNILFIIGGTGKEVTEYCKKQVDVDLPKWHECGGRTYDVNNYGIIIYLQKFDRTPLRYGCLVHEIGHAADYILDKAGWIYLPGNNEPFTYLCEFLTRKFLELYNK
jgi:hypothetical protein